MRNDEALQRLLDEREIERVLATYCHALDRCDSDLLRSVYHEDAEDHRGVFEGTASEFIERVIPKLSQGTRATTHQINTVIIDVRGDVAEVQSYVMAVSIGAGADPTTNWFGGRYLDRFERRDGLWKIAHRLVVLDVDHCDPHTAAFELNRFRPGLRTSDDPAYQHFAEFGHVGAKPLAT